jgi:hypothetical protein
MYLLNTESISLTEFNEKEVPKYAILSHRWNGKFEISFQKLQELQKLRDGKPIDEPGYSKIEKCCAQTRNDRLRHIWIDSCCIDKSSSAELSEAINSMFRSDLKYNKPVPDEILIPNNTV